MPRRKGANINLTWTHIFDQIGDEIRKQIESNGFYDITANQLRKFSAEVSGPDVRNLAKFDKMAKLPDVFKTSTNSSEKTAKFEDYINILPLGNVESGEYAYRLGKFNAYAPLQIDDSQKPVIIPYPDIQTVTQKFIVDKGISENTYIDLAVSSGMLDEAFGTASDKLYPVMHGRLRSPNMNFNIGLNNPQTIQTGSNQLEIDATFENSDSIVVIEAKAVPEEDFLVRQLYYPYYVIRSRGVTKKIRPTFLLLQEGNFYFNEYEFSDPDNYSTIRLVRQRAFRFADSTRITINTIRKLIRTLYTVPEPHIAFPQANSRTTFVKTLGLLNEAFENSIDNNDESGLTPIQLSNGLGFADRQGGYYGDLVRYLGLGERDNGIISINDKGRQLLTEFDSNVGRLSLIKALLAHQPFRDATEWYLNGHLDEAFEGNVTKQAKTEIGELINQNGGMYNVDPDKGTFTRRVDSTIALVRSSIFDVIESED